MGERERAFQKSLTVSAGRPDKPATKDSDSSVASRPKPAAPTDTTWYTGVVKWSRGSMAWLTSEELQVRFPGQDVFLHRSECRAEVMPRQMDRMVFRLTVADGNPKALDARTEAAHEAAKGMGRSLRMSLEEYRSSRCTS